MPPQSSRRRNVFSPEMTARLVQSLIQPNTPPATRALDALTTRELEILGYLAAGHSNKIIARKLNLAESTIKVHVQSILRKLELSSRVQAAVYAVSTMYRSRFRPLVLTFNYTFQHKEHS